MDDKVVGVIFGIAFVMWLAWMFFLEDIWEDILKHRKAMKQLEIDKLREERKLLEAKQYGKVIDLHKPE